MTNKISSKIVEILIKHSLVENEDKELYSYGFFILLSQILYFIIVTTIGILFNIILESVIFYIAFQFIRRYAGGYHAATETRCEILSTLSIIASIGIIKLSKIYDFKTTLLIITLISMVIIFIFCPLDTSEKPLTEKEFKYFRKISWIILSLIIIAIIVSFYFKFNVVFAPCCASLILEGVLIGTGKIKKVCNEKRASSLA